MTLRTRRAFLAAVALSATGGCTALGGEPPQNDDWPSVGYDAANAGHAPDGSVPSDVSPAWTATLRDPRTSPVVADGTVLVGTAGGLEAFDAETGERRWRGPTSGAVNATPTVAEGAVIATEDGRRADDREGASVRAFDLATGDELWRTALSERAAFAPTVADGTVYVRGERSVRELAFADGSERWRVGDRERFDRDWPDATKDLAPAVAEGVVLVPDPNAVTALDAATGDERWRVGIEKVRAGAAIADGTAYLPGVSAGVRAVSLTDGTERWTWAETGCWTSPAVADDRVFATDGFDLVALDAGDGTEAWRTGDHGLHGDIYASPAVVGETVVVGSIARSAVAFAADGGPFAGLGRRRWRHVGDGTRYSPAVAGGRVFTVDGRTLLALGEA